MNSPATSTDPRHFIEESPEEPLCRARGISKVFEQGRRTIEVLAGVDLEINRGEMIAIVGKSGTGKTTLLQIIGGLDRPSGGSLLYAGEEIIGKTDRELSLFRNRTIGFVFQFHHLLPEFTAMENTLMPGLIAGLPVEAVRDEALGLLAQVGLADRTGHKIGELSGGEQQRVALARALIMKPLVLLADEPTGNLDPATGKNVFELIRELNRSRGLATVMVTHNLELADQMNRQLTLSNGRLHHY